MDIVYIRNIEEYLLGKKRFKPNIELLRQSIIRGLKSSIKQRISFLIGVYKNEGFNSNRQLIKYSLAVLFVNSISEKFQSYYGERAE